MTPSVLSIDFETASAADLKRTGVHTYSEDPSTQVLCMAWAFDQEPVVVWRQNTPFPNRVLDHVANMGDVRGWNVAFELAIWNNVLDRQVWGLPPLSSAQVTDTMAQAAYYGLPLSLDQAGPAAGLTIQKDKAGHALMMRMCRPRATDPITGAREWWHHTDPVKFDALCAYCAQDVEVERALAALLPALPDREARLWRLDNRMNTRGVGVDYTFVHNLKALALASAAQTNAMISALTGGVVKTVTSTAALLAVLQGLGYPYTDLKKDTVARRLDEAGCFGLERDLLELRADGAKTSAAKLDAMLSASVARGTVGHVRGMLQYYGASRTGRWAGRLIQLQNMPRGELKGKTLAAARAAVQAGASLAVIELLFGPAMRVVSSLLRSCIVSPPGRKLLSADSSQIEARVLPWLAGQDDILDVFRSGGDVYAQAAAGIFGLHFPPGHKFKKDDVTEEQRQIGKVAVLALGFGGGKGAFITMAANYGVRVSEDEAEQIKLAWRAANRQTVQLWWALDAACQQVIRDPGGGNVAVGDHLLVGMWGRHLVIRLPSGRSLVYRDARLESDLDTGRTSITYMGLNQYTRKWERLRTYGGKLAENVTQAAARDVLAEAMLALDDDKHTNRIELSLTVHDELLGDTEDANADAGMDHMLAAMKTTPAWAPGLPVGADGWIGDHYRK